MNLFRLFNNVISSAVGFLPKIGGIAPGEHDHEVVIVKQLNDAISGITTGGTLDQAYDFGGAGLGRTITADAGAVKISGEDGLLVTGTFGSGADSEFSGSAAAMFFNPKKGAFRAGYTDVDEWDNANIGDASFAAGYATTASGASSIALGESNFASGDGSVSLGTATNASGQFSVSIGNSTTASGQFSVSIGNSTTASGDYSNSFGLATTAESYSETAIGIYNTDYTPTSTSAWSATDRLFVIGNGQSSGTRSDALVMLKDGSTTLNGSLSIVDGTESADYVFTSDVNGNGSWVDPNATESFTATDGGTSSPSSATRIAMLAPAGTIATHTLNFPPSPRDGQIFRIVSNGQTITALTIASDAANGIIGGITTLTGQGSSYVYILSTQQWCAF